MKIYSTYCKELDPFSKDFDPQKALKQLDINVPASTSIDAFEQELMDAEDSTELVNKLIEIDRTKTNPIQSKPMLTNRGRRLMIKKQVIQWRYEEIFKQTGVEYLDEVGFALAHGGPFDCLRRWVKNQTRVTIKLQANSPKTEPNRCIQAIITAFDKHWNLMVRDCDEVYLPTKPVGYVKTREDSMPKGRHYTRLGDTRILSRYSKCTIIMGRTIACIYDENTKQSGE